jgi:lipoprotein-anchoring transpeptidase ErfK/SrfK
MNKIFRYLATPICLLPILINPDYSSASQNISQQVNIATLEEKTISVEESKVVNPIIYSISQRMNVEESPNFYINVDKKNLKFRLFQKYPERDELLLETPVALGKPGHSTPAGEFYIRRVVENPFWYPTKSSNARVPSKPGKNNPYGMWMSELFRQNKPGDYSFPAEGDTLIRIHSTNSPSSIGKYASNGCTRLSPPFAEEFFPALLHFIPHKEPKKNSRGIIYPLEKTIPVTIK